ncbi:hypothetical protein [Spiroplasma sp. DGKH1]|uniref:hypothetical protein n=1 Tax=Spiroplasma sp. DGKH1 TaxID=3050074 RepID=UPI0034C63CB9
MKNIYDEIVGDHIININIKNPQYESNYYKTYWNNFLPDFFKKISDFYFVPENIEVNDRIIYLELVNRPNIKLGTSQTA